MHPETIAIVLVRPQEAGNVGSTARAIKNFGFRRLILVDPRVPDLRAALTWAHGAEDVCEGAEVAPDLRTAVAPFHRAWGTTRRGGRRRAPAIAPRDAAEETASLAAGSQTAWVFGPEATGLHAEELALCSGFVTVPTSPDQPSLNLSHAVAVCLYEMALAGRKASLAAAPKEAPLGDRHALYAELEAALLGIDFLHSGDASARMSLLRRLFERAHLSADEVRFLRGLARQVAWAGKARKGEP